MRLAQCLLSLTLLCTSLGCETLSSPKEPSEAEKAARRSLTLGTQTTLMTDPSLAGLSIDLPDAKTRQEWSQAGGRGDKIIGHIKAAQKGQIVWAVPIMDKVSHKNPLTSPPILVKDRLFILDSTQTIHAISTQTGENIWSHTLPGLHAQDTVAIGGGIGYGDGKLIIASGFGYVTALDPAKGKRLWTLETGIPMSGSPSTADGRAYIHSYNNDLFAIDIATGESLWLDQTISEPARMLTSPSSAITENLLVAPFSSGELIAYLPANGRRLWVETLSSGGRFSPLSEINDIAMYPVIVDGIVYAASQSGLLVAVDSRTGTSIWSLEFPAIRPPAIAGDFLFAINTRAELICVNRQNGDIVWVRQMPRFQDEEKKKKPLIWSSPLLVSGRVMLVSSEGNIHAVSVQDGSDSGILPLEHAVTLDPISANGRLYILADDGTLMAIE